MKKQPIKTVVFKKFMFNDGSEHEQMMAAGQTYCNGFNENTCHSEIMMMGMEPNMHTRIVFKHYDGCRCTEPSLPKNNPFIQVITH